MGDVERRADKSKRGFNPLWFAVIGLVVVATVFATLFFSRSGGEMRVSKTEQDIVSQVQSGQPLTAKQQAYLEEQLRKAEQQLKGGQPAATPEPTPAVRADFKAEYKETASAKGKIKFEFRPSNDPEIVSYVAWNITNRPLLAKEVIEQRDGRKVIATRTDKEWYKVLPGEKATGGNWQIKPEAKRMIFRIDVTEAN